MATNKVYQFEGDQTQALANMTWRSKLFVTPKKVTFDVARIIFIEGDLDDFQALVDARAEQIKRNERILAEGAITGVEIGGGFIFADYILGGDNLETVVAAPSYAGSLELIFKLYADDTLKFTKTLYTSDIFKCTTGYRSKKWYYQLEGNIDKVLRVDIATSSRELKFEGGQQ